MGRRKLPPSEKKSQLVTLKLTVEEHRQLRELTGLPNDKLAALFDVVEPTKFVKVTKSSIILWLISSASRRLQAARNDGAAWAETGKSLPLVTAADRLGIGEERLRDLFKCLGITGRRDKRGYRYALADVEYARAYMAYLEKNPDEIRTLRISRPRHRPSR
jgi:hypothetical protein